MRLIAIIIILWIGASVTIDLNQYFLPKALGVFDALVDEIYSGQLFFNTIATFGRVAIGLLIGAVIGLPTGLVLGLSKKIRDEVMPLIEFLRGIPTSMLFPVFIVAFGIGELSKAVIVASATIPIILINTVVGCMPRPETEDRHDYLAVHSESLPWTIHILVTIWDALLPIIGGFKTAISISLVLTIVTEMFFVSSSGVGWAAHQAYLGFDLDLMYSYVIVVGIIGLLLNLTFDKLHSSLALFLDDPTR